MKPKEYLLMLECVEKGVAYGIHRAHKHEDDPSDDHIRNVITDAVMAAISEYWAFDDDADR
jgi:hypothetical protein